MPRTMTKAAIDYLKAFVAIDCACYCFPRDASALATRAAVVNLVVAPFFEPRPDR
jgi:hypothetical protein